MKRYLPCLMSCVLVLALFGCSSRCDEKVHVSDRSGVTGTYTDSDGKDHQITTDDNGDVTVPCGTNHDGISMVNPEEFLM
jgi:hypothetical protein